MSVTDDRAGWVIHGELADRAALEAERLAARISFLLKKASRMPAGNGRDRARAQAALLLAVASELARAVAGKPSQDLRPIGSPRVDRVIRLIGEIRAV